MQTFLCPTHFCLPYLYEKRDGPSPWNGYELSLLLIFNQSPLQYYKPIPQTKFQIRGVISKYIYIRRIRPVTTLKDSKIWWIYKLLVEYFCMCEHLSDV